MERALYACVLCLYVRDIVSMSDTEVHMAVLLFLCTRNVSLHMVYRLDSVDTVIRLGCVPKKLLLSLRRRSG